MVGLLRLCLLLLLLRTLHVWARVRGGGGELVAKVGIVGHLRRGVRSRVVVLLVFGEGRGVLAEKLLAVSVVGVDHVDAGSAAGRRLSWAYARLIAGEAV